MVGQVDSSLILSEEQSFMKAKHLPGVLLQQMAGTPVSKPCMEISGLPTAKVKLNR